MFRFAFLYRESRKMRKILPIGDVVRNCITTLSAGVVTKFRNSILPIYGSKEYGTPDHIGTCIALRVDDQEVLLTAAHVIDENNHTSLYVGGKELIPIEMEFLATRKANRNRDNDHYDFAIGHLPTRIGEALNDADFISETDIDTWDVYPIGTMFTIVGYPNSRNRNVDKAARKVVGSLYHYSNISATNERLMEELGISENSHILLGFDQKYSTNECGKRVNSVALVGMSGGPVFRLGRLSDPAVLSGLLKPQPFLSGMVIEYNRRHKLVVSTRMRVIIQSVRDLLKGVSAT